jgi:transitional endoplasmic reticulum ATPase
MPVWRLLDFHEDDLDQAVQLWDQSGVSAEAVFAVSEVMAAARSGQPGVVAAVGDELAEMAVAQT